MSSKELGKIGENIACDYLKNKGYKILDRNYVKLWDDKTKGEIDIVARKNKVISFIEVKTMVDSPDFFPEDKVNFKKQKKLIKLAQSWLSKSKIPLDSAWQIDAISVVVDAQMGKTKVQHFENVVSEY